MASRPREPDVRQPALLGELFVRLGLADRQGLLLELRQEHGIPFEALPNDQLNSCSPSVATVQVIQSAWVQP